MDQNDMGEACPQSSVGITTSAACIQLYGCPAMESAIADHIWTSGELISS
jgi:hypothetical protein